MHLVTSALFLPILAAHLCPTSQALLLRAYFTVSLSRSTVIDVSLKQGTQIAIVVAQEGQDEVNLPTVTALMTTTTTLGGVIGVALVGAVISNTLKNRLREYIS
ncbi:hypothetical protein BT96DRAFT_918656 [Gymnopus androsaceus JB14]|uniref:Uncharacterized protein n=1 Tax=Gymnopus androsaceus JB14 TaxID=1447944 RepID=A0A6A4HYW7_9AGAR|nr:hypothetical protein BT96DRAFT_918656 [Gymnopus androsaceus JB14]